MLVLEEYMRLETTKKPDEYRVWMTDDELDRTEPLVELADRSVRAIVKRTAARAAEEGDGTHKPSRLLADRLKDRYR